MHMLCWVLAVTTLLPCLVLSISYNKNGDYIIGAILPLTKDSGNGKCTDVNPEGKKVLISSSEYPPSISKTL